MAGLYESWRDPSLPADHPSPFRWTCTVITTDAEDDLGYIHDRMPLMVPTERWTDWLDPTTRGADLLDLLAPAAPGRLEAYPVSALVSNVRNNGPALIEPLPIAAPAQEHSIPPPPSIHTPHTDRDAHERAPSGER